MTWLAVDGSPFPLFLLSNALVLTAAPNYVFLANSQAQRKVSVGGYCLVALSRGSQQGSVEVLEMDFLLVLCRCRVKIFSNNSLVKKYMRKFRAAHKSLFWSLLETISKLSQSRSVFFS